MLLHEVNKRNPQKFRDKCTLSHFFMAIRCIYLGLFMSQVTGFDGESHSVFYPKRQIQLT